MHVSIRKTAVLWSFGSLFLASCLWAQGAPPRQAGPARPQQMVDPRLAGAQALPPTTPQAPPWWPQSDAHQKYVSDVLNFWEQSSSNITHYQCKFSRWEYDPVWGPKPDPKTGKRPAVRISYGEIKYAKPDKGLFKVNKVTHYTAAANPADEAQFLPKEGETGEHWVCDGKSIFQFDHENKKLIEHQLPPDMQGKAIVDGPLPFLFGAEARKIQERYWVGVFTPKDVKGQYWLEAWPKYREDAKNYKKVEIIIDEKDFLPMALQIYDHNGSVNDPSSTVLTFEEREVNFDLRRLGILDPLGWTKREFIEPNKPFSYKKEVIRFDAASGQQPQQQATLPRGTQATRSLPQIPLKQK